jgi:hypothetical protein
MPEINITINVEGDDEEAKVSVLDKKKKAFAKKMSVTRSKTKHGRKSILQMPPMIDDSSTRRGGILDMMGV